MVLPVSPSHPPTYRSKSTTIGRLTQSRSRNTTPRADAKEEVCNAEPVLSPERQQSPSQRMLKTPRKLMHQMSFRSMMSPSPSLSSAWRPSHQKTRSDATNNTTMRNKQPDGSEGRPDEQFQSKTTDDQGGGGGMGTLFGDAWIARPPATLREEERVARDAPIYPISSRGSTLYEVDLDNSDKNDIDQPCAGMKRRRRRTSVEWEYHQPDSLYGWRVLGCAFVACLVSLSTLLSYSVYQEYYLAATVQTATPKGQLPPPLQGDAATLVDVHAGTDDLQPTGRVASWHVAVLSALIGGLMGASAAGFSLPAGLAADIVGYRVTAMAGTLIMAIGLFSSSFIEKLQGLCVTQGLVCGTGIAFVLVPAYSVAPLWFDRHRALATGVAVSGGALGLLVLTPAYRALLRTHGMAASLQLHALVVLVLGLAASLGLRKRIEANSGSMVPVRWRSRLMDARVWALMAMALFAAASRFAQFLCLPAFARANGLRHDDASNVIYALGASLLVGAIGGGLCADRTGYVAGLGLSELLMGAFTLVLWAPASSPAPMFIYAVLFGLCSGALAAVLPAVVAQMFGVPRLASTIGLVVVVTMPAILVSVPAAARFLDLADHHRSTAWLTAISGVLSLVAGVLGLTLPLLERRHRRRMVQHDTASAFRTT
ncbi:hypothetical protein LPJ74_003446 [Coemansia sp. RSA 1843]|nr:hypothetical protein LPJ74_003446 [Coemansia sp. RSA 1843]